VKKKKKNNDYNLAKIKVIGIGGAGNNAVSRMYDDFPRNIDLIAINTDIQDLNFTQAKRKIHIGKSLTKGLGTGMNPDLGRQAAEENRSEIMEALQGADIVFITAGFGGGTGTGAAPIVAEISKELGILTIAVVTKPFGFEGIRRNQIAQEGLVRIRDKVDTLITIPNDRIFSLINQNTSLIRAFEEIDEVLKNSVQGISDLIMSPGIVNVDFADVKTIMSEAGSAIIGIGVASGQERHVSAANLAINSPLLESSIDGAKGVLFSISGNRDLKMNEINEIAKLISENVDQSAKIIFGAYHDRKLRKGQLKVTIVATGFNGNLNAKSHILLPDLFAPQIQPKLEDKTEEIVEIEEFSYPKLIPDEKASVDKSKNKEKPEKKKKEEIWDIPAFLRKKKRR
jgi:cell division protein FtsZ